MFKYKLVMVGGPLRGQEFQLSSGENSFGSDPSNTFPIKLSGISKSHLKITASEKGLFLEDLKSANGTFVNGKMIKSQVLNDKDQITLPNAILQVVYIKEKKIIIKKQIMKINEDQHDDNKYAPPMPNGPGGKVIHIFKYKIMPVAYAFNQEYEWRWMVGFFLTIFVLITVALTIFPVLSDNKSVLVTEVMYRGFHYADVISQYNTTYLAQKDYDAVDTRFLDNEPGVEGYELLDLDGRIIRPLNRLNDYSNDTFSIDALKAIRDDPKLNKFNKLLGSGRFGIAKIIKSYDIRTASEAPVAVIAIRFSPHSLILEAANNSKAYLESFSTSAIVAIFFFGIIYFLTIRHFEDFQQQIDLVLRNKQKEITNKFMFSELAPLKNTMNTMIQKYLEIQGERASSDFSETEDDNKYVEMFKEIAQTTKLPLMILNSGKNMAYINLAAEDLVGIRDSASNGQPIFDVARDQGFAAVIIDLCDQSANDDGRCKKGNYEISGNNYEFCITCLIGKDHFAKAYYITFIKED